MCAGHPKNGSVGLPGIRARGEENVTSHNAWLDLLRSPDAADVTESFNYLSSSTMAAPMASPTFM